MRIVATTIALILIPTLIAAACRRIHHTILFGERILFSKRKAIPWPRYNWCAQVRAVADQRRVTSLQ
jgi:hypothetical protein